MANLHTQPVEAPFLFNVNEQLPSEFSPTPIEPIQRPDERQQNNGGEKLVQSSSLCQHRDIQII